ncbi:MAG: PQQ-binding-like beta-propeller repeat protein [Candidatus Bathyarchaeota archaeon]|nr:PQQ-binding-like beta-propeller repeat protein [Candidatus Bathyarchaeum sp.]
MKKLVKNKLLSITVLFLLVCPIFFLMNFNLAAAQQNNTDLLQYEWPNNLKGDMTVGWRAGSGPAPASQNILWDSSLGYPMAAFNGLVFLSGGYAVDPWTGDLVYQYAGSGATKIDETYFFASNAVFETATGTKLFAYDVIANNYDPDLGMFWTQDSQTGGGGGPSMIRAWNWPDITQAPTLAWEKFIQENYRGATLIVEDGRILVGTLESTAIALDAKTGDLLWETPMVGYMAYDGAYYDGKWIQASQSGYMYCFDAATGNVLWTYDPQGFYSFWSFTGAIYDGKVYAINCDNHVYAIDIETGQLVWKWKTTDGGVGYPTYTIAGDGKVFAYTGRSDYTDPTTGERYKEEYVCLDADTGEFLWKTRSTLGSNRDFGGPPRIYNILAYGNLYLGDVRGQTVAYGPEQAWTDFQGNPQHTGESLANGPEELSLKWTYDAGSGIYGAPAAYNGKIYVGSNDGVFHAVDHMTGELVWTYETGDAIKNNPAIYGGNVYFASDDGYQYCLDADAGTLVWKTYIGSDAPFYYHTLQRHTSSPTIVDGLLYVGSRNFTAFCLDAETGNVVWNFDAGGLISNNLAVSDGAVYLSVGGLSAWKQADTGGDNGTLYKLNANTGAVIWETAIPYHRYTGSGQLVGRHFLASPVVADGIVFQASNAWGTYAIDVDTGEQIWWSNITTLPEHIITAALPYDITPVYVDGKIYIMDFFSILCRNATNGDLIWSQYLGHNWHGGPLYADGKIYVASELQVCYVLNAETGEKLDFADWQAFCWSSPCIYDNKLYWGTVDWLLFCYEQTPYGETTYYGTTTLGSEMTTDLMTSELESEPNAVDLSVETNETTLITTETAIIATVVVAAIIGAVSFYIIRKRK